MLNVPNSPVGPRGLCRVGLSGLGLVLWMGLRADVAPAQPPPEAGQAPPPKVAHVEPSGDPLQDLITYTAKYDQTVPLLAGAYDADVTRLTARVLENMHYSRHPLDAEYADRFFQRYLDLLDPQRFHFTQEDIREFEKYRTRLSELTLRQGDTRPAYEVFARYLQRVDQRATLVAEMLQAGKFDFSTAERYTPYRKDAPWPENLEAARALWRQHLRHEYLLELLNKVKPEEITRKLALRYKRMLRTLGEFDREDIHQFYLSALANAYDPHSDYMGKAQLDNFAISMKLSLFGIGALLRSEDGYCTIESLTPGGPAARSKKLKPKDRIIAVQQEGGEPVDVVDMKLNKVVEMIRGPKDTKVTLTIIPADAADSAERRTVTLVRDEIKLEDQAAKARLVELPETGSPALRVGVIDLPSFYSSFDVGSKTLAPSQPRSTTEDVRRLIRKLVAEGASGLILDLRRNGGGSLEEAIKLTGLFIREGPVVQVRDAVGEVIVERDTDSEVAYDGPLVVLTSRFSASASEILAAALQDYDRALVVGDKSTHGKGTVQTIYELSRLTRRFPDTFNPGALKVTIRKFYRANGASTQLRGMSPDIVLPLVNNEMEVGEANQPYALPWDSIPVAQFERVDRVAAHLPELRRRSEIRRATDPDWAYVMEDIEAYRQVQADRSLSLNLNTRLKEKEEQEARSKARKQDQLARAKGQEKVYEITLKLAEEPGLPPPLGSPGAETASTNPDAEAMAAAATASEEGAEEEADAGVSLDITLKEAKRLLGDLIELSRQAPRPSPVATTR